MKRPFPTLSYKEVPLSDILAPKDGRTCYGQSWWLVKNNDTVFFSKRSLKQDCPCCNNDKRLFDMWELPEDYEVKYLEMVYLDQEF